MPINIKLKEPEQPKELPIEWVATGHDSRFHVKFFRKPAGGTVGVSFGVPFGDDDRDSLGSFIDTRWGKTELYPSEVRELANALLKMADQIEGK